MRVKLSGALLLAVLAACSSGGKAMSEDEAIGFANRYASAWNSQDAQQVADFYSPDGSLQNNSGAVATGRAAVKDAVQEVMSTFPDLRLVNDGTTVDGTRAVFRWTLTGTSTGADGKPKYVRINGAEEWLLGADHLIARSVRRFDQAYYDSQMQRGLGGH